MNIAGELRIKVAFPPLLPSLRRFQCKFLENKNWNGIFRFTAGWQCCQPTYLISFSNYTRKKQNFSGNWPRCPQIPSNLWNCREEPQTSSCFKSTNKLVWYKRAYFTETFTPCKEQHSVFRGERKPILKTKLMTCCSWIRNFRKFRSDLFLKKNVCYSTVHGSFIVWIKPTIDSRAHKWEREQQLNRFCPASLSKASMVRQFFYNLSNSVWVHLPDRSIEEGGGRF